MADDSDGGFAEHRRLILSELKRIGDEVHDLSDKIQKFRVDDIGQIKTDIALLQLKAGIWGGVAAVVVTMAAILLKMVK